MKIGREVDGVRTGGGGGGGYSEMKIRFIVRLISITHMCVMNFAPTSVAFCGVVTLVALSSLAPPIPASGCASVFFCSQRSLPWRATFGLPPSSLKGAPAPGLPQGS